MPRHINAYSGNVNSLLIILLLLSSKRQPKISFKAKKKIFSYLWYCTLCFILINSFTLISRHELCKTLILLFIFSVYGNFNVCGSQVWKFIKSYNLVVTVRNAQHREYPTAGIPNDGIPNNGIRNNGMLSNHIRYNM